ncbi:MAG: caspase family protein [bacterium]|nr:caspase family protein [bacterium]
MGARRAVCIGIDDYPGEGMDLAGCANDARAWARLLVGGFGFRRRDIRLILDREASRDEILAALDGLVAGARPGDVCAFVFSGHGTWVPDAGVPDESDGRDEALVPREAGFDRLILDDDLRRRLDRLPDGVSFTFISDSCYSGTVTRIAPAGRTGAAIRFLPPPPGIRARVAERSPLKRRILARREEEMTELLLAAAAADEPAAEDDFGGTRRGVFSHFAARALEDAGPGVTYAEWMARVADRVAAAGYAQRPQLEGPAAAKRRPLFSPC